jgi:molecular chaperone DnaK
MVKDAESHANEELRRREEAEARNQADNAIYAVEKALAENANASADDKAEIEAKLEAAKEALKGSDVEAVKRTSEELLQASHKLAQQQYGSGQQAAAGGGAAEPGQGPDDVVEGEVVDEG